MTHDYKKITQQFGVSYLFTLLSFVFGPILIFILTRTLSVAEYGIYSILSSTIAVLSTILYLALNAFIITKLPGFKYLKRVKAIFSIVFFELIFLVIVLSILFIPPVQNNLLSFLKLERYKFEFQLSLIIVFVGTLLPLVASYLTANRKIEFESFISFLSKCLWVILLISFFLIFRKFNLAIVFILWSTGVIISLIILLLYLKKDDIMTIPLN